MARRCQDCKHWNDSVFLGEGASGGACWEGYCGLGVGTGPRGRNSFRDRPRHSLMLACDRFERHPFTAQTMPKDDLSAFTEHGPPSVREAGVEPASLAALDPKDGADRR